jgi:cytochrome P450
MVTMTNLVKQPQPGGRSFFWGNINIAAECVNLFPPGTHPHNWVPYIRNKYATGNIFYVDLWPLGPRIMYIADPEVASKFITTGQSLPKSPLETDFINKLLGDKNMVSAEGHNWKSLRTMFNPGFSASHLMTLVPYIVDASMVFHDIIQQKAETGELFQMEEVATRLTIDIIGKVVLDSDFDSQKGTHPIVDTFRERVRLMPDATAIYPWQDIKITRPFKLWVNGKKLDRLIGQELDLKINARAQSRDEKPTSAKARKKSVVDLALDGYEHEIRKDEDVEGFNATLNAGVRGDIIDSMKTFIFAGHDTTASTISYIYYLLHFHPTVYRKLRKELDDVFGATSTTADIAAEIEVDPHIINKLDYTNAIIKETLRLFPPASTMRYMPAESDPAKVVYLTDPKTGRQLPLSGWTAWPPAYLIARNEEYFPSPAHFIPERFIPSQTPFPDSKLLTPAGKDAWRPFEKGPRHCIGQELAMIESKVIMALAMRDFDFVAEFDGKKCDSWTPIETVDEFKDGRPGSERRTIEGHRCYQVLKGAAKPRDSMPGRVTRRGASVESKTVKPE